MAAVIITLLKSRQDYVRVEEGDGGLRVIKHWSSVTAVPLKNVVAVEGWEKRCNF